MELYIIRLGVSRVVGFGDRVREARVRIRVRMRVRVRGV